MLMLTKQADSPSRQPLRFRFGSGKYEGYSYVADSRCCPSPVCTCGHLDLDIEAEQADPDGRPVKHTVGMDVIGATLDRSGSGTGVADEFGQELVRNMDDEDWLLLKKIFYDSPLSLVPATPSRRDRE